MTVSGCKAGNSGGGLFAELSQSLVIRGSIFERNEADKGAAIEYASQDTNSEIALIVGTAFEGNVGETTVSSNAPISWICERGQYMPPTSGKRADAFMHVERALDIYKDACDETHANVRSCKQTLMNLKSMQAREPRPPYSSTRNHRKKLEISSGDRSRVAKKV